MSKVLLDCSDAKFLAAFRPQPHFTRVRVAQMSPATMSMPSARPCAAISMATATPLVLDTSLANSWAPRHPTASNCIRLPKPSQVDSCLFVLASSTRGGIPISYRKGQIFWQSSRAVLIFLHLNLYFQPAKAQGSQGVLGSQISHQGSAYQRPRLEVHSLVLRSSSSRRILALWSSASWP